jgi:hypothetical protein
MQDVEAKTLSTSELYLKLVEIQQSVTHLSSNVLMIPAGSNMCVFVAENKPCPLGFHSNTGRAALLYAKQHQWPTGYPGKESHYDIGWGYLYPLLCCTE